MALSRRGLIAGLAAAASMATAAPAAGTRTIRFAQFNTALSRPGAGVLIAAVENRERPVLDVARIILRVRPDVLLLNEFDHDPAGRALAGFAAILAGGLDGLPGLAFPHRFHPPSNTGEPTGLDLDGDGRAAGPGDAYGFGRYPGHFAMALLSRLPIRAGGLRTYRLFRWSAMPGARRPVMPAGMPHHPDTVWRVLRLSSKSHWDVPLALPDGGTVRLLAAHPTPPVFDGPEDLNGRRNADELRLLQTMIRGAPWLHDDAGAASGGAAPVMVMGDLNADPFDGAARRAGIAGLLADPRLQDPRPRSPGAVHLRPAGQKGPAAETTAAFRPPAPAALRVDYVLPDRALEVADAGVFWPAPDDPLARLAAVSDHRMVWVDIRP